MNNEDKIKNRSFEIFLFAFGVIILIVMLILRDDVSVIQKFIVSIVYIGFSAVLSVMKKRASDMAFAVVHNIAYMALGTGMSHILEDNSIFFCVTIMQIVLSLMIMDSKVMKKQSVVIMSYLIVFGIIEAIWINDRNVIKNYIICSISILGIHWLCGSISLNNEHQKKLFDSFERSQDELIRVIEAKCDEAREATKSKSQFLSNMSHEIRTPLNSILGMNELILRECDDSKIKEYAEVSDSSGRLLLSLINDILDFSKIESGKMEIVPINYQLSTLILDNIRMLEQRFSDKGLELAIDIDNNIPDYLVGDEMRIRQILTNIMTNALKYTDVGMVTLRVCCNKSRDGFIELIMSVKDTGKGITEEDKKKLFKNFSRVDMKNNRNIEGTGLGLAITAKLIEAMGGSIGVESTYGVGSEFIVTIPQEVADYTPVGDFTLILAEKHSDNTKKYHESFTAPNARVLVTDDTPANLRVVQGLLKQTKVSIETASSGAECIKLLKNGKYDLLFLDHMMPEMDGVETLNSIRSQNLAVGMPIIALTANTASGAEERYKSLGFDGYLSKPVLGSALEEMLIRMLPEELIDIEKTEPENEALKENTNIGEENMPETETSSDITEIDKNTGLNYCGGMEDLYIEMLEAYCEQYSELSKTLADAFDSKDIGTYRITAHAIKSTSLTIGAKAMYDEALEQENAAKQNNLEAIESGYHKFADDFMMVVEKVKQMLSENHI